jgi:hypothetical protein
LPEQLRLNQIFQSQGKPEAWLLDGRGKEDSEDKIPDLVSRHGNESDDSSVPPQDCNQAGRRQLARRQAKKQAQKAQSVRPPEKLSGHPVKILRKKKPQKSSSSKGGRKKHKKSGRPSKRQTSRKGDDSSDPSPLLQGRPRVNQKMAPRTPPPLPQTRARRSPRHHPGMTPLAGTLALLATKRRARSPSKIKNQGPRPTISTSTKMICRQATPSGSTEDCHLVSCQSQACIWSLACSGWSQRVCGMSMNGTWIDKEVAADKRQACLLSWWT